MIRLKSLSYTYTINLDERGEFYADVRDSNGKTVYEIHTQEAHELVEDGFVADIRDPDAIGGHLRDLGLIPFSAEVISESRYTELNLYSPHDAEIVVEAKVPLDKLHAEDRKNHGFIAQEHRVMLEGYPEEILDDFSPEDDESFAAMSDNEKLEHAIRESILDEFHAKVPIKVLDDFDITVEINPHTLEQTLEAVNGRQDQGPSPTP